MTREQIETLQEGSIIECDYGLMMVASFEDVERSDLKEKESDSDYVRLVFVDGVYNDCGIWRKTGESDVYQIEELQADEFKIIEKGESSK